MNRRFGRSGELKDVDLLAAFVSLWKDRASVTLDFTRAGVTAGLDIADGEVISTFSADPRFETSAILVRAGKLDAGALERLSAPEGSDRALAAMQAGVLTRREWKWGEKIRAIEVLSDLLTWGEGRYLAEPDTRSVSGEFRLPIPRLLLELFLRSRDRALVDHQLGSLDAPLTRSEDFEAEFATFGLTADAESVVHLIDGKASAREIASRAPADAFAVEKLLAALVTLELLEPEAPPADAPASGAIPGAETDEWAHAVAPPADEAERAPAAADTFDSLQGFSELPPSEREVRPELTPEPEGHPLESADAFETQVLDAASVEAPGPGAGAQSWDTLAPGPPDPILERVGEPPQEPRRRGQGPILAGVLAFLVLAVSAVLMFRSRTGGSSVAAAPERTVAAAAPTHAPVPTQVPPPTPVAAPTGRPATVQPTRAPAAVTAVRPTSTARAAEVKPAPTRGPAAVAAGPDRKPWMDRAEASRRRLAAERNTRFSVQLLLACEVPTLEDAFRHEQPPGSMWLLPTDHKGRACFKVLWGRFGTADEAKKAKEGISSHFVSSSNKPAVVAVR